MAKEAPTLPLVPSASQDAPTPLMQMVPASTSGDSSVASGLASHLVDTSEQGSDSHSNSEEALIDHDVQTILDPIHGGVVDSDGTSGLKRELDHPRTLTPEATGEEALPTRPQARMLVKESTTRLFHPSPSPHNQFSPTVLSVSKSMFY